MEQLNERIEELEKRLKYSFKNKQLLIEALSHSSYANEKKKLRHSNERLEFLHLPEGELTKIRASLVCEKSLHEFAKQIRLGDFILLGKGEENTGGRERPSILADAFEAVIAAIYLDGGIDAATTYVLGFVPEDIDSRKSSAFNDYKTVLQEIIQKNPEEKVEYHLAGQSGPDHNKAFKVQVCLNSNVIGTGVGKSKKEAEQMAAKEALELMGYETQ